MTDLDRRIQVLEDREAIKDLRAQYSSYCDDSYNADGIASLFVEDGVWDGGTRGRYEGREAIRGWFERATDLYSFAIHWILNPLISVDGDAAQASWYLFMAATLKKEGTAIWTAAKSHDELVRVNGVWRFRRMVLQHQFTTPYDVGWAKQRTLF